MVLNCFLVKLFLKFGKKVTILLFLLSFALSFDTELLFEIETALKSAGQHITTLANKQVKKVQSAFFRCTIINTSQGHQYFNCKTRELQNQGFAG